MTMINKKFFFSQVRLHLFGGSMNQKQVNGVNAILEEWEAHYAYEDDRWLAYMLATTHHETGRTMQPIEEWGKGRDRPYGKRLKMTKDKSGNRIPYTDTNELFYGRGFVQLTWYENYDKAGRKLGKDFLHNASGVLELGNATKIMFLGMTEGWFTGAKLSRFFNPSTEDWKNARKIINGTDKWDLIKDYALKYYSAISYTI
jgi:putative chitinase